jgi:hypothetical protein
MLEFWSFAFVFKLVLDELNLARFAFVLELEHFLELFIVFEAFLDLLQPLQHILVGFSPFLKFAVYSFKICCVSLLQSLFSCPKLHFLDVRLNFSWVNCADFYIILILLCDLFLSISFIKFFCSFVVLLDLSFFISIDTLSTLLSRFFGGALVDLSFLPISNCGYFFFFKI